jgi:hypothetical protein
VRVFEDSRIDHSKPEHEDMPSESKLDKRARRRIAEFERAADRAFKIVAELQRATSQLLGMSRDELDLAAPVAARLRSDIEALLPAIARISGTDRLREKVAQASRRRAADLVDELDEAAPKAARISAPPRPAAPRQPRAPSRPQPRGMQAPTALESYVRGADESPKSLALLRGSTDALSVVAVVETLALNGATGLLTVQTRHESIRISLCGGDVIEAISDRPPAGQRLGEILVARGALDPEQLDELLARRDAEGGAQRIGELLATEELVTREQLREALAEQIQHCFLRVFHAENATYAFFPRADGTCADVRLGVTELLLESARVADEERRTIAGISLDGDESDSPTPARS